VSIGGVRASWYRARRTFLHKAVPELVWPRVVVIDGVEIAVRRMPYSAGIKWMLAKGEYEAPERELVAMVVEPGMSVIEMGGSIGVLTAILANRVGENGRVVSVEASQSLADISRTWLEVPAHSTEIITGFAFPVLELPDSISILGFNDANGSLGGRVTYSLGMPAPDVGAETGTIVDLLSLMEGHGIWPDVLVVDIEGSEIIILDVEPRLPPSVRHLIIELHPHLYPGGREDLDSIIATLRAEAFEIGSQVGQSYLLSRT
jgi:FkbM family methyltransferase